MPEPDPPLPPQEPISDREPPVLTPAMRVSARTMRWRYFGVGTGFVILCALVFFIARHEPVSQKQYYPQCGFKKATGLDCPGCGGLRSVHALAQGNIGQAIRFHGGFVLSLPIVVYLLALWIRDWRRDGVMPVPLGTVEANRPLSWVAILIVAYGLLRLIPVPPFSWLAIPEMDNNETNATAAAAPKPPK